jgi:protein-ribulosamine 3-kinase
MLSAIPLPIQQQVSELLKVEVETFSFCNGGGCINQGGKLTTSAGDFFLKWNDATKFPGMFEAEAKGLQLMGEAKVIHIPKVILEALARPWQFILLEYVEEKTKSPSYWEDLGQQLANLHRNTFSTYGLDHNNYIGSLQQENKISNNWIDFFIEQRLNIQLKLALDNQKTDKGMLHRFERLFKKLPQLLPVEKPSLLHGDLWSGNLITNAMGNPCLIDPAVYYGHREAEIAFTRLFGGFSGTFYESYNHTFPLQPGFAERIDIYNLYPLMVHVNLFGGGYLAEVVSILNHLV